MTATTDILVADIGGTNSRFAAYRASDGKHYRQLSGASFATGEFDSFPALVESVGKRHASLQLNRFPVAVFGVPGPVLKPTEARLTNIPWDLDTRQLASDSDIYLVNDFEAQAFGCLAAGPESFRCLKHPERGVSKGMAVVGAGTGIGHCAVKIQHGFNIPIPSEAGQIPFPFHDRPEYDYLDFATDRLGGETPNGDRIVSGQGLSLLHEFLSGNSLPPEEVAAGLDPESETTRWFARFYARLCRNYCLSLLPIVDVLFISGGVAIKNPFLVDNQWFLDEFTDSGTKGMELSAIAIRLAVTESLGLLGAAHYGHLEYARGASPR